MNFNSDITKIPITSYPIPGLSELIEELPQTGQVPHHSLLPHENRHDAANRILNTPDTAFVSQLVDAYATTPTEHINAQHDPSSLDSVNASPLLQAVLNRTPDVYGHRNLVQPGMNPNLSHVGAYPPISQNPASCSLQSSYPSDPVPSSRVPSLYSGNANRTPVSRPVQAVAPQPRHPRLPEKCDPMEESHVVSDRKAQNAFSIANSEPAPQEENPKICLKIRRTKKGHRSSKEKHSKQPAEYGIVSSDSKPEGAGPIKLKLSRLKPPTSGDKEQSSEQTFKVSSLTTEEKSGVKTESDDLGQKKAEDAASAMVRALFKDRHPAPQSNSTPEKSSHKSKSSKSEKRHKHKPHKNAPSSSHSENSQNNLPFANHDPMQQQMSQDGQYPGGHHQSNSGMHMPPQSPMFHPNKPNQLEQGLQNATNYNQGHFGQSPPFHSPPPQNTTIQTSGQFVSPPIDQRTQMQMLQQQGPFRTPQTMSQYNTPPQRNAQSGYSPHMHRRQGQMHSPFTPPAVWDGKGHSMYPGHASQQKSDFGSKPPPYKEAMLAQQRAQNQMYQAMNKPMFPPSQQMVQQQQMQGQQQMHPQHHQQQLQKQHVPHQVQVKQELNHQSGMMMQQQQVYQNELSTSQQQHQQQYHHGLATPAKTDQQQMHNQLQQHADQLQSPMSFQHMPQSLNAQSYNAQAHQHHTQQHHTNHDDYTGVNYMNTPKSNRSHQSHSSLSKSRKKGNKQTGIQHVRVKFIADAEEADIYKLKDIMFPDDTEVSCFEELHPGMNVVAKWPMNGKLYAAIVIDPLDNTGRRFRERKPPPKPFQAQGSSRKDRKEFQEGPSLILDKLGRDQIPQGIKLTEAFPSDGGDGFNAYISMADRIKLKRRERLAKEARKEGKKRKRDSASDSSNLINMDSGGSGDEEFASPARKRSHHDELRKRERRRAAESRLLQEDGPGSFQRLLSIIRAIFDDMDTVDPRLLDEAVNGEKGAKVPQCLLISRSRLQELNGETAKLKAMGLLNQLPRKVLVRLLTILEPNIRDGVHLKPMKPKGHTAEEQKWNRDCYLDRVNSATEAALTVMHIMTAQYMPKAVYIDDVIEQAAQLLRHQLNNTVYPEYDLVYKTPSQSKKKGSKELSSTASTRMKRAHYKGPKNRTILHLYNKLNILLCQMVELVSLQPLTDTSILQISSLGISPFFVENVRELQLSAIRLTTAVFSRYDKHRSLILEDIFHSLARLPTSKRNLRSYRLTYAEEAVDSSDDEETSGGRKASGGGSGSGELQHIQMVSALVLQMIHAIVNLPMPDSPDEDMPEKDMKLQHEVDEIKVIGSYDIAVRTGQNFLAVFLKKCASKSEEIDYRPLFENLVHDLLATVNKPEWPASEMLLSVLGRLLVHTFSTKSTEMSLRVASLDYLGVVAAKLRRDAVTSHTDVSSVQALLKRLEEASAKNDQKEESMEEDGKTKDEEERLDDEIESNGAKAGKNTRGRRRKGFTKQRKNNKAKQQAKKIIDIAETEEEKLTSRLQYLILGYMRRNAASDPSLLFAHNFYIGQWLRDVSQEFQQLQQLQGQGDAGDQLEAQSIALQSCQRKKNALMELASSAAVAISVLTGEQQEEDQKKKPVKMSELQKNAEKLAAGLTVEDAALVSRHLASTRPFSRAFDCYLSYILRVREESAVALRTRAIKCLAEVVAVDPSIMEREDIAQGVQSSLVDPSTSVREAAIDLVGKFILLKPDLVKHYYHMLTARILDTGVSVRKRVIRILRDLCHEYPNLPQLTDACVKMIRRVNDEDGIKKLVHEVFMKMWFTPVNAQDSESLRKKALLITDIVAANRERGYEWIEQLFKNLIDTPTRNPQVERACQQIVDCLVQHIIIFENPQNKQNDDASSSNTNSDVANSSSLNSDDPSTSTASSSTKSKERSIRLVATVQTLVQLARIRPGLLVPHVMTLQPYLATKCESPDDILTVHGVCRTLELSIPLMEHPSELFLASIEEDMMRMILTHRFQVVAAAVACLGAVTCRVTHNFRLIWDCFQRMCHGLSSARSMHQKNPQSIFQPKYLRQLLRTIFIIGHFCKNFDFDSENIKGKTQVCVKDKVYDCLLYFTNLETTVITEELRGFSISALGLLMVQDPNMMFRSSTRELYGTLLDSNQKSDRLKKQVLQNLQNYLQTEDVKMQQAAEATAKKHKHDGDDTVHDESMRSASDELTTDEDIKELSDVSSGMASSVMQLFLKQVLEALFHRHVMVRHAALHTTYLTLQQGLVHPVQCVPYLIAAASDPEPNVHKEADQQLVELNKRYHGFVHTKALQGMRLAYQLQSYVQKPSDIIRGYLEKSASGFDDASGVNHKASCSQLYQLVRSDRKHRRALLLSLLNLFDDTVKTELSMLVFVADNLAYFPYHTLDEPLFLISQIEVYVSVSGSNVLQSFKESLQRKKSKKSRRDERRAAKLEEKARKRRAREENLSNSDSSSSSSSSSDSSSSSGEDDDSDDEGSIESRLPLQDEPIEEFAHLSLACLLLLWLKQHLKAMFGFTDNKIHRYSPTEVNRANDKQCHRRRPDLRFDPMPALEHIIRKNRRVSCRDREYIDAVVKQYNEFNELMNKLDPNEEDSDSDKEKKTPSKNTTLTITETPLKEEDDEESDRDTDGEMPKPAAPLDAIRQSTALKSKPSKHKKHNGEVQHLPPEMRKRHTVKYIETSSEEEDEFHGF